MEDNRRRKLILLLEKLRHELVTVHGVFCTDRPDMISDDQRDMLWYLNYEEELKEIDSALKELGCRES